MAEIPIIKHVGPSEPSERWPVCEGGLEECSPIRKERFLHWQEVTGWNSLVFDELLFAKESCQGEVVMHHLSQIPQRKARM